MNFDFDFYEKSYLFFIFIKFEITNFNPYNTYEFWF